MTFFFWMQFAAVCVIGAMSPGPSLALIIRNSIQFNRLAGILSSIGHAIGIGIYATLSILGLHFILTTNIFLFNLIEFAGSCFLIFLGFLFLKDNNNDKLDLESDQKNLNSFFQGFMISILNPKILIWFAAIYSQFIQIESTIFTSTILILTASVIDGAWYVIVAFVVTSYGLKDFFLQKRNKIQKISGVVLIFIAILLLYKLIKTNFL